MVAWFEQIRARPAEFLLQLSLGLAPVGLLFIRHWFEVWFFIGSLISLWILARHPSPVLDHKTQVWLRVFVAVFCLPVMAILISQQLRDDFEWSYYDAPSRFIFAIPILLVLVRRRISVWGILQVSLPLSVIFTVLAWPWLPKTNWAVSGLTTWFVDPLSFGRLSLELGLLSLLMVGRGGCSTWSRVLLNLLKLAALVIGVWFSVRSTERTGWLGLPVILYLYVIHVLPIKRIYSGVLAALLMVGLCVGFYKGSSNVHDRVQLARQEVMGYQWNTVNPDNSVGMRISFARMGAYYFGLQPLLGWGDKGFARHINDPELSRFATQYTREFSLNAGFHNEVTTNAVRSGVWGIISTLSIFLMPAVFFAMAALRWGNRFAFIGFCYVAMEFIAGMSTEVLNLKFTATFYACLLTLWLASALNASQHGNDIE